MVQDILNYFELKTTGYTHGLFNTKLTDRPWSNDINKTTSGVSYTQFIDAKKHKLTNTISLLDVFHGLCAFYMSYFITMNPDWIPMKIYRPECINSLIHSFAIKEINGITYFADARGITDNCIDFFSDYRFSKKTMQLTKIDNLPELDYDDMLIMKKAYDIIYHNKPITIAKL